MKEPIPEEMLVVSGGFAHISPHLRAPPSPAIALGELKETEKGCPHDLDTSGSVSLDCIISILRSKINWCLYS